MDTVYANNNTPGVRGRAKCNKINNVVDNNIYHKSVRNSRIQFVSVYSSKLHCVYYYAVVGILLLNKSGRVHGWLATPIEK